MGDWKTLLKADPTNWLLEEENASVRYFTLKDIMGRPEDDSELQIAKQQIMESGSVPDILQKQKESAYIQVLQDFKTDYPGFLIAVTGILDSGLLKLCDKFFLYTNEHMYPDHTLPPIKSIPIRYRSESRRHSRYLRCPSVQSA